MQNRVLLVKTFKISFIHNQKFKDKISDKQKASSIVGKKSPGEMVTKSSKKSCWAKKIWKRKDRLQSSTKSPGKAPHFERKGVKALSHVLWVY